VISSGARLSGSRRRYSALKVITSLRNVSGSTVLKLSAIRAKSVGRSEIEASLPLFVFFRRASKAQLEMSMKLASPVPPSIRETSLTWAWSRLISATAMLTLMFARQAKRWEPLKQCCKARKYSTNTRMS